MATCTFRVGTADDGNTPNASGAFTPASGDLLIVLAWGSEQGTAAGTCTSSTALTFTEAVNYARTGGSDVALHVFVSDALVSDTSSQTVTFHTPDNTSNASTIFVFSVSGMSRVGLDAVLQTATASGAGGAPAPEAAFSASALTGNPTLGFLVSNTAPAGMTPPTSWTEPAGGDLGTTAPAYGSEVCSRDSGFTGTTITWGSIAATAWGVVIVELDASSAGSIVPIVLAYHG